MVMRVVVMELYYTDKHKADNGKTHPYEKNNGHWIVSVCVIVKTWAKKIHIFLSSYLLSWTNKIS